MLYVQHIRETNIFLRLTFTFLYLQEGVPGGGGEHAGRLPAA